jgi:hypothetical protein
VTLDRFGGYALVTKIPFDNQLETYEPGAKIKGAKAYEDLAQEVAQHVNVSRNATNHGTIQASEANVAESAKNVGDATTLERT